MGRALRALTLWLVALAIGAAPLQALRAQPAPGTPDPVVVEVRHFSTLDADVRLDRIVSGAYDPQFLPVQGAVQLRGGSGYTHWLRLNAQLPADAERRDWMLRVERTPIERMALYLARPGGPPLEVTRRFFRPDASEGVLFSAFGFPLPVLQEGELVLYAAVTTRVRVALQPVLLDRPDFHLAERAGSNLASAVYAALLVLALSALAMWAALRESAYLHYVGFTGGMLVLLAAANGHLYALAPTRFIGWWGPAGIYALSFACCAMALGLTQHFVQLRQIDVRANRAVAIARWLLLALAAASLLNLHGSAAHLQQLSALLWVLTGVAAVVISAHAWRRGQPVARAFCLTWLLIGCAVGARALLPLGWLAPGFWTLHGFQLALAFGAFMLSVGLAERVMEFRKQRDRARLAKEQTDASLQVEQRRRELVEGLREDLRVAPAGDLEWLAMRRLLAALLPLVPQKASAVVAFGYHDGDLLLTEPAAQKDAFARLLATRGGNIKGICRGRTALQVRLEHPPADDAATDRPPEEGSFAIVPLAITRPGWGAVIVERAPWEEFAGGELHQIAEFAQIAIDAADEAASQADMRRRAEIDPLTGAFNRRAGDQALDELLASAVDRRLPLSVLLLDLDHFRQVNERHGDAVGDDCLRQVGEAIRRALQPGDLFTRHAGGVFLLGLPGRQPDQARQLAERLREAIAQLLVRSQGVVVKLTASIGVAGRGGAEESPQPVVERAERALHTAKRHGRNQVQLAPAYSGYGSSDAGPPEGLVL